MTTLQPLNTKELTDEIVAEVGSSIQQTIPFLPRTFTRVLAKVLAAALVLIYKYAGWMLLQQFSRYASFQETTVNGKQIRPLAELGKRAGLDPPNEATRAELVIEVTVIEQVGSIASTQQFVRAETGIVYLATAAVALDAATVQLTIRATASGAGTIGNLEPGDAVSFVNAPTQVANEATVVSQTVTGADAEDGEVYRGRVQRREQRRPQGGAYADYQAWGEEVAGVLNVYPYTSESDPGFMDIYVEATEASSGSEDGIPTTAQLDAVQASIEANAQGLPDRQPATAFVRVLRITRSRFDFTIAGLEGGDTVAATTAINAAVDDYLRTREPFIDGLSVLPRRDRVTQAAVSGVADEAASALGSTFTTLTLQVSGFPVPAYTLGQGEKARLGTPAYT